MNKFPQASFKEVWKVCRKNNKTQKHACRRMAFFPVKSQVYLLSQNSSEVSAATGYLGEFFSGIFTIQSAEKLRSYSKT